MHLQPVRTGVSGDRGDFRGGVDQPEFGALRDRQPLDRRAARAAGLIGEMRVDDRRGDLAADAGQAGDLRAAHVEFRSAAFIVDDVAFAMREQRAPGRADRGGGQRIRGRVGQREAERYGGVEQEVERDVEEGAAVGRHALPRQCAVEAIAEAIHQQRDDRPTDLACHDQEGGEHAEGEAEQADVIRGDAALIQPPGNAFHRGPGECENLAVKHGACLPAPR